jgi:hypothetical protein
VIQHFRHGAQLFVEDMRDMPVDVVLALTVLALVVASAVIAVTGGAIS